MMASLISITIRYINNDIQKHLKEHEDAQKLRDSPDLLFRPFLRWLDRNLESLFTKALKQVKNKMKTCVESCFGIMK